MSTPAKYSNYRLLAGTLGLGFVASFATQAYLQTINSEHVLATAKDVNKGARKTTLYGVRGSIFDRNGQPLSVNGSMVDISITRGKVPESDGFWLAVSNVTGIPSAELADRVLALPLPTPDGKTKTVSWSRTFTQSQWDDFSRVVRDWRADGLSAVRSTRRENPLGAAASNIVGIIAEQASGPVKTELEYAQDAVLRPENGYITAFQDRNGYILPNRVIDPGTPAVNGQDIRLTIDSEVQKTAYDALKTLVMREQVDGASAVVMIPKTGEILAATSFPSIDPATGVYDGFTPQFANKPQTITVEAGSTFKTITLAIALQEKKTTLHDSFIDCPMWFKVGKKLIHCDRSHKIHGHMDSVKAIAVSCNKAAATWAMAVGPEKFQSYFKRLGLLAKPGIFSPNSEKFGKFDDTDSAKMLQIATVGFGQNILLTPIGLLTGFATIANDGVRPTAHLIERIGDSPAPMPTVVDRKIDVAQGNATAVGERIFSPEVCAEVKEAMKAVFYSDSGTGKNLKIPGFSLAGKTGTAETGKKREGRSANFIGFIPAEKPEAVILVMIQNHRRKFYGGVYAGEVFQKIALTCIDQLQIPCSDPAKFRKWRQDRIEMEKKKQQESRRLAAKPAGRRQGA